MSLSYEIRDGIVFTTAVGRVDLEETEVFLQTWLQDPALPDPILLCRDSRQADMDETEAFEISVSAQTGAQVDAPPGSRMAIIASSNLVFGLSRMYSMSADFPFPVKVFRDKESAVAWLKSEEVD